MGKIIGKIKAFWKKGKWQKFVVIIVCLYILGAIGNATGVLYARIHEIEVEDITLTSGESKEINYTISPDEYDVEIVSTEFKVENEEIAKIENNTVVGLTEGETKIQVIITDNHDNIIESNKAKITVNLSEEQLKAKEEAELEEKRNTISNTEALQIKDYCEQIINDILKSPSSAEYPGSFLNPFENWNMMKKNNLVTVASYVDAQNSFGATLRSQFVIQIQMDDEGNGSATYVQFDEQVLMGSYVE